MDRLRAQLWNHLDWLESRGLTGALSFAPAMAITPQAPTEEAVASTSTTKWRLGFYSSSTLLPEEETMVIRIAMALGLQRDEFRIWADESLVRVPKELLSCPYVVALGPGSGQTLLKMGLHVSVNSLQITQQGSPLLTIPHPRAMLQEPSLKSSAWTALQNLKSSMLS